MDTYIETILANIFLGIGILFSIYFVKFIKNYLIKKFDYIVAFVGGVLSGIVFLGFIPKILILFEKGKYNIEMIGFSFLIGILIFFITELFFHFHHCKDLGGCEDIHKHFSDKLMLIGTFIHNFLHGIVLYTGFLISFSFGIVLTLSVFLHSIPQNIANYLLNHKDIKSVIIAASGGILGSIFLYPVIDYIIQNKIYILAVISGMLLYLIISDILPEFKKRLEFKTQIIYLIIWVIGLIFYLVLNYISKVVL